MAVKRSEAQDFKAVALAANTPLPLLGANEMTAILFVFPAAATGVKITERSSKDPTKDSIVPTERLVFNPVQLREKTLTVDAANKAFTSTGATVVGWFVSAYHDTIQSSVACTVLLRGRATPKGYVKNNV